MAFRNKIRFIICVAFIVASTILILCGMNVVRALYLALSGVFLLLAGFFYNYSKETPRGICFWLKKSLYHITNFTFGIYFVEFIDSSANYTYKKFFIWLGLCIVIGILTGTLDYFYYRTDCDEAEFAARKKRLQEIGEQYDKVVKEMDSEKE